MALAFGLGYAVPDAWRESWTGRSNASGSGKEDRVAIDPEIGVLKDPMAEFASVVEPILENHCHDCHGGGMKKGGLDLQAFPDLASMHASRAKWKSIRTHVAANLMPPADEDPVTQADKETLLGWIDQAIFPVDPDNPDPGQFTIRRLNRAEYRNTIRDLLGVTVDVGVLPPDDAGYGFDNIGDVLSLAPAHLERYQQLAAQALALALDPVVPSHRQPRSHPVDRLKGGGRPESGAYSLFMAGAALLEFGVKEKGRHKVRLELGAEQAGSEKVVAVIRLNGETVREVRIDSPNGAREIHEFESMLSQGPHRLELVFTNDYWDPEGPPGARDRNLLIHSITTTGPLDAPPPIPTPQRARLLPSKRSGESDLEHAQRVLSPFLAMAFRRPVEADELARYFAFVESALADKESGESAIRLAMEAALVSPDFLFRGLSVLRSDGQPGSIEAVSDMDLASRLSYFIWSSAPDEHLLRVAEAGALRGQLADEVDRMLDDPRAEALVNRFFLQWLQVQDIEIVQPDEKTFHRGFNSSVRQSMLEETRAFCRHLLRENRPAVELLTADYTFADQNLRKLYRLPEGEGSGFEKVDLQGTGRRGILTHASVLTITSNPTRTSPVKRGKWVLENILAQPPPPPPPNVPSLESLADIPEDAPLRMKLEAHQANPACASCHKLMDGIGFSFEHFDGIGRHRENDGERPIDPRGTLATGEAFASPEELIRLLVDSKKADFHRAVAAKMLTFALGRGLDYFDEPALQEIVAKSERSDGRMRAFIHAVVASFPFQHRRIPSPTY